MNETDFRKLPVFVWAVVLFFATLLLHTRHNTFPFYYHPDEPSKVEQVMGTRAWNFHHPMLLLTTTKLAAMATRATTAQQVVETGRWVSAVFTASAVVALSLLGMLARGRLAGVGMGLVLMLHHQLFELSHYMKEDTALLFGLALSILAAHGYVRQPSGRWALLLGGGCALAISGKSLGVLALIFAVPALWPSARRRQDGFTAIITLAAVLIFINLPLLRDWRTFSTSFVREAQLVVEGQGQITQNVPHGNYWNVFLSNSTPVMWLLLLAALGGAWRRRTKLTTMEWITLAFPFAYAVALSFLPKDNDRYFLPATALLSMLAVLGAAELARWFNSHEPLAERIAIALLVAAQLPSWTEDRGGLVRYWQAFERDDNAELVEWLRKEVPSDQIIAKDNKVRLPTTSRRNEDVPLLPHEVRSKEYAADIGSLADLHAQNVAYVLITDSTFQKFDREGLKPKVKDTADFDRRKLFYAALRREDPVKRWPRSTVIYLHPGIEVYRLAP